MAGWGGSGRGGKGVCRLQKEAGTFRRVAWPSTEVEKYQTAEPRWTVDVWNPGKRILACTGAAIRR